MACAVSWMSTRSVPPATTVTVISNGAYPRRSTRRICWPTGTATSMNRPSARVEARAPESSIQTSALDTGAAFDASVTVPTMLPVGDCADTGTVRSAVASANFRVQAHLLISLPPFG